MAEETVTPLPKRLRKFLGKSGTDTTSSTAELIPTPTAFQCTSDWCGSPTFGPLLEDSSTHDVVFKTSDGGSVGAHRVIVAAGSPVFRAMLYGNMRESSQKEIELPTTDTATLNKLVTFLYTGKVDVDSNGVVQLLEAAHYFDITSLLTILVDFFRKSLLVKDIFPILEIATDKNFDWLLELCLEFMYTNAEAVANNENFKNLSSETIISFCKSSDLTISEIDLFSAVVDWYKYHQHQIPEAVVKSIFQEIRYPLICRSDLINTVRPTKMADPSLYTAALEYYLFPDKYEGPESQIISRKYQPQYMYKNATPECLDVSQTLKGLILKNRPHIPGIALCFIQVQPTEQRPVHFKIKYNGSNGHLILVPRSKSVCNSTIPVNVDGGIDLARQSNYELDGTVAIKGNDVITTIGGVSKVTPRENEIYLCLHIYAHCKETWFTLI